MPKVGRNDPCPCGSEKKYKKCHLDKPTQNAYASGQIYRQLRKSFKRKKCLHPLASRAACGNIINAHTIQKSVVLSKIVDKSNHVLRFYGVEQEFEVQRIGWRDASTFAGFCDKHDSKTFAPLEAKRFHGSKEQCFLIGYRSICYEMYQKGSAVLSLPLLRDALGRGKSTTIALDIANMVGIQGEGVKRGEQDSIYWKKLADKTLLSNGFSSSHALIIQFEGDLSVVSSGAVTPTEDFDGNVLQVLHDLEALTEYVAYSVVVTRDGGAIVFSWPDEAVIISHFIDSLLKFPRDRLPDILVQFMFAYVENTYFSSEWWNSISEDKKRHIALLAANLNPYYGTIDYSLSGLVPWRITKISRH